MSNRSKTELAKTAQSLFIHRTNIRLIFITALFMFAMAALNNTFAQSAVNGGFEGRVIENGTPLAGVLVQIENQSNGFKNAKKTDANGYFRQTMLQPGVYIIRVSLDGFQPFEQSQELYATRSNSIIPIPINLQKITIAAQPTPAPTPVNIGTTNIQQLKEATSDREAGGNLTPRRDAAFNEREVQTLPLGGRTLTRTFDEFGLLALGVAPPPQAIGNSVGPGVGGGVGTSGQFSINGLRSRANNFLVDGADNNDEDIGVRRQGFFALVPQPIESIQEFQIITLLAPAEFGRNLGGQVNALSKSGGNSFHGTFYGMFNSESLNAGNFFDTTGGDTSGFLTAIQSNGNSVPVLLDGNPLPIFNDAGEEDDFSLLQGGFAVGGPIVRNKAFFFVSGEGQRLRAAQERNFAVPTVEQRGLFGSGAEGLAIGLNPIFPTSVGGDAVFSLFPFANNPNGVYGRNTYTQALSADAWGRIFSGKVDWNIFKINGNQQTLTARYNYTEDSRDLTDVGGALFSSIRPMVRTDNFSSYLTGSLTNSISNELRFSWGRTDLEFEELRDTNFLLPIDPNLITDPNERRFLLNAPILFNNTLPNCNASGCFLPSNADYGSTSLTTADFELGPIGQLIVAGFSPVGVDVFNFPQERTNNTYQIADILRWQAGNHLLSFGTDIRRTYLDSNLPRNSRPLVTFNGSLDLSSPIPTFAQPQDLAAAGGPTGFFQSLVLPGNDARIKLSFNQLNFFVQDSWRVNQRITLSFGLRYEYNTTPEEADNKIENTFGLPLPARVAEFSRFIDGRTKIFESDKNNFAPRFGIAAELTRKTVLRGGFGVYYDQILGSVVSQSRNVFPTFTTLNFGGGLPSPPRNSPNDGANLFLNLFNPIFTRIGNTFITVPGTLNTLNPAFVSGSAPSNGFLDTIYNNFPFLSGTPFGATLPTRQLDTPRSYQYFIGLEQEFAKNTFVSVGYVGTTGRNLLRFTTPNLGINYILDVLGFTANGNQPIVEADVSDPDRPFANIGSISQFETTGNSRYDSLQIGLRGRLTNRFQYQANYTFGKVEDDVSDVFDLAGAFSLPQNSLNPAGEYAPANFDVRHRFTYSFIYDLPSLRNQNNFVRFLLGDWTISGTGKYNSGQPFTVNSIFDINRDGNLTDRLDNTQSITITDDRRQPLSLAPGANLTAMLANFGQDGSVPRNSFRAGSILELDLSFLKQFKIGESKSFVFRTDVFNFINRANFGIPVRILEAPGFGQAVDTVTPGRRIQFSLKFNF